MTDVRVILNRRGIAELVHNPQVQRKTGSTADKVAERAADLAPKDTGEGAASIHAEQESDGSWHVSWDEDHYYMFFQEFGTEFIDPHPFLRPAAGG